MKGGTQAEYLVRRLKRDYPHIANKLAQGEFKSAPAAAIEAGIIIPPTPLDDLRKAWKKASHRERAASLAADANGTMTAGNFECGLPCSSGRSDGAKK